MSNLMAIVKGLATLKQLDQSKITVIIKDSLYQAISKKLEPHNNLEIVADFSSNSIYARFLRVVVEQDISLGEISLLEAKRYKANPQIGDFIEAEMEIQEFEPKVIKNAKKIIMENIKQLEEERIMFDYEKQKNQIVSGKILRIEYIGYIVNIGYAEAVLPVEEQIENEFYKVGDNIRAYVINIRKRSKDVVVVLSRTHPDFVNKLFESEIPEVMSKEILVKKIVREPGIRTKIAIQSVNPKIDVMGACLGPKGIRMETIKKELHGEQIDLIIWSDRPEQLIANAIGEDLVEKVFVADRGKFARVIVLEKNKNLAIGKKGKNVRLAGKLTDYKLDIYTQEEFEEKMSEERRITSHISELEGVNDKLAEILRKHGYTSVQDVFNSTTEELARIDGIGVKTSEKLKESAQYF